MTNGDVSASGATGAKVAMWLALVPVVVIGVGVAMYVLWSSPPGVRAVGTDGDWSEDAGVLSSMVIPEFRAVDQEGREVGRSVFTAPRRYTVLNFVFTRCVTVCPITTGQMSRVQEAVRDIPASVVQLVSFSVDPEHDTPAALKEHASGFADFSRWTFVTADAQTVKAVVETGLGFALESDEKQRIDLGGGASMANIVHPSKLLLISPEGKVTGMYRGMDEEDVSRLIARLRRLKPE